MVLTTLSQLFRRKKPDTPIEAAVKGEKKKLSKKELATIRENEKAYVQKRQKITISPEHEKALLRRALLERVGKVIIERVGKVKTEIDFVLRYTPRQDKKTPEDKKANITIKTREQSEEAAIELLIILKKLRKKDREDLLKKLKKVELRLLNLEKDEKSRIKRDASLALRNKRVKIIKNISDNKTLNDFQYEMIGEQLHKVLLDEEDRAFNQLILQIPNSDEGTFEDSDLGDIPASETVEPNPMSPEEARRWLDKATKKIGVT